MITNLIDSDIPQVVKIHIAELPGFLSELGEGFLAKYYFHSLSVTEVVTICKKEDEEILGFATGATSAEGLHFKIISRDILGFGIEFLKYFITHPKGLVKIIKTLSYPGLKENDPELLTIAVHKKYQGKGIGKKLFTELANEMKKKGKRKFLVSVYDRMSANGFYKRIGCRFYKQFDFLGEKMNYYEYRIT